MLETHFVKMKPKHGEMTGQLPAIIYNILPDDCLLTKYMIRDRFKQYAMAHADEVRGLFRSDRDIFGAINILVQSKFVKEIHGIRLQKLIESI